ncbi:hypothetical protein MKW92_023386 [Papaver armeniacum]|nr:hypothetical protein MKW92_023386 [Papaver armeniacum]
MEIQIQLQVSFIIPARAIEIFSPINFRFSVISAYGLPFVFPHNILVTIINGIGVVTEGIHVVIFMIYAPTKDKLKLMVLLDVALIVFTSVSMVSLLVIHKHETGLFFCGLSANIFSMVSPLSVMYMPFLLSLFVFLCGTSWFVCGLLGGDPFITGCVLTLLDML